MDNGASSYRRFLDGDDTGIVEIIRDYKDGLILYLNGITGNIHTAEELMEDTFVKLVTKKPRFSGKSSFKTWLYAIGRNRAVDHMRREKKISHIPLEESEELLKDKRLLEENYIWETEKIMVHQALEKLKPEYRQILYLKYFEDFSNEQAAKIMRKSKHQIENLVYRARLSLKAELEKEGFVYEKL
ncbi:MAG: RNA polymerase sigma factor [Agathobacter sp.]|nr:RNA polymerase sigma factor [Agathobacter sp.]MBQ2283540.1 RNA polymerase sigma factor [Agathobacter sp.]